MTWEQFKDLLPVITFALGIAGGLATEWVRGRMGETARRRAAREAFEMSSLLELMHALEDFADMSQDVSLERRASTNPSGGVDPDRLNHMYRLDLACSNLVGRLFDLELHTEVQSVICLWREYALDTPRGKLQADGSRAWTSTAPDGVERGVETMNAYNAVVDALSLRIRKLHEV